jgi:hypothetical protein
MGGAIAVDVAATGSGWAPVMVDSFTSSLGSGSKEVLEIIDSILDTGLGSTG